MRPKPASTNDNRNYLQTPLQPRSPSAGGAEGEDDEDQGGDKGELETQDEAKTVGRGLAPATQEDGAAHQAPKQIRRGAEQVGQHCLLHRPSDLGRIGRDGHPPLPQATPAVPGEIEHEQATGHGQKTLPPTGQAVQHQEGQCDDRPVGDERGGDGWQGPAPAVGQRARHEPSLQGTRLGAAGQAEDDALESSSL